MKPLLIDFAGERQPWRWDARMPATRLALVVAVVSLAALAAAWQQAHGLQQEIALAQAQQARLAARQDARAERQRKVMQAGGERALVLQKAAAQRALPWEAIFRAFESVPAARLEAWAPDVANGVVKVQAQADDIGQVQDYLAALGASPVFVRVSLQRHELGQQGQGKAVNFTYEAVLAAPYRLPESAARSMP